MKIAFVVEKDHRQFTGDWFANNPYRFFIKGMGSLGCERVDIEGKLDWSQFANYDAIILNSFSHLKVPFTLDGLEKLKCVKCIRMIHVWYPVEKWLQQYDRYGIDFAFHEHSPSFVQPRMGGRTYYQIIPGIDPNVYRRTPWADRQATPILLTGGAFGRRQIYSLRGKCVGLPTVRYLAKGRECGVGDGYAVTLGRWRAGIAASCGTVIYKQFELPCTGMLTFIEDSPTADLNEIGFLDGENCVFITEDNYIERFQEYVDTWQNTLWSQIAERGCALVRRKYNNMTQCQLLLDKIQEHQK